MNDKIKAARDALRPPAQMEVKLPKLKSPPIKAWSLSTLKQYEECPLRVRLAKVEKLPEGPKGDALIRGDAIHKAAEKYVKDGGKLPTDLAKMRPNFAKLRKEFSAGNVSLESEIAFDVNWQRVDWFAKDVYVRIKWDVILLPKVAKVNPVVIDYKTGKVKEYGEYDDQLELYDIGGLTLGLGEAVESELWFTDHGMIVPKKGGAVKLKYLSKLQKKWDQRAKPLLNDTRFSPRPGNYCRWCAWTRAKGGPCVY